MFDSEGGEILAQVAQRGRRFSTPGTMAGQAVTLFGGLSNLLYLHMSLLTAQGLDWMDLERSLSNQTSP